MRQVVIDKAFDSAPDTVFNKPFRGLELRSAALARLQLGCDNTSTSPAQGCTEMYGADLTGAGLECAFLTFANLTDANLTSAYLAEAQLDNGDLTDADLSCVDQVETHLFCADLTGAILVDKT